MMVPMYACLERSRLKKIMLSREICRPGIMNKFAGHQVQVSVLVKYFRHILFNLLSQERAQLRLQQVFYPGGERGKSVNIEASINREVTEAGAELSIMRCSLD